MPCIYTITHIASGRCDVECAIDVKKRWGVPLSRINRGMYYNPLKQRAWAKYDGTTPAWKSSMVVAHKTLLIAREQFLMDTLTATFSRYAGVRVVCRGREGTP